MALMTGFPDESQMERSEDGSDPIRGGSIALNRILGLFVDRSKTDHTPMFHGVLVSGYTVFTNVFEMAPEASIYDLEAAFIKDLMLFLEYYNSYLSFFKGTVREGHRCPVYVYFPNYKLLPQAMRREPNGKRLATIEAYAKFMARHNGRDELVKVMEHVSCHWGLVGNHDYPHRELMGKIHDITRDGNSMYHSGDPIAMLTHIPLDLHLSHRLRNLHLLERFTGRLKASNTFGEKIDKEGRLPFFSVTHGVFGDSILIKPQITHKLRKQAFEAASKDRWISRSEEDVRAKLANIMGISVSDLRKYDFR